MCSHSDSPFKFWQARISALSTFHPRPMKGGKYDVSDGTFLSHCQDIERFFPVCFRYVDLGREITIASGRPRVATAKFCCCRVQNKTTKKDSLNQTKQQRKQIYGRKGALGSYNFTFGAVKREAGLQREKISFRSDKTAS